MHNVIEGDTLRNPFHKEGEELKTFDIIVSNPPFNMDFSNDVKVLEGDKYNRFFAGIPNVPAKKKESMAIYQMFLQHIIKSLNGKGRAAVVVPTGFISKTDKISKGIRQKLIDSHWLKGVISLPRDGDILMTSEAPLGEFYYMLIDTNYCLSQRLFALRADDKMIDSVYMYYEMSIGHGYSQIIGKKTGSTVAGIRQEELRKVNILVPDFMVQKAFSNIVIPLICTKRYSELDTRNLLELKTMILPMLLGGQLIVK